MWDRSHDFDSTDFDPILLSILSWILIITTLLAWHLHNQQPKDTYDKQSRYAKIPFKGLQKSILITNQVHITRGLVWENWSYTQVIITQRSINVTMLCWSGETIKFEPSSLYKPSSPIDHFINIFGPLPANLTFKTPSSPMHL